METRARSLVKTVIWVLLGLVMMAIVGFVLTGSLFTSSAMALINSALGFVSYLIYERIWAGIRWGRHV
ncbi:MAG: DUF2061 domain-containing protein [Pelagimonas sp.]|jgi:uncharacterized membrane protein|nr:DUF2061 domain-containing protein [Pelagimonas sp.]